ncbi:MAG: glucose-1-phosphate thymidylyltransferase RfbA [Acidimicrobiales bacterium]
MKGIILAGGAGTRLHPATRAVSKQLLCVYDKPMVYYPLSTLMLAGLREVLLIATPDDMASFKRLLGTGSELGISISYAVQQRPAGIAEALVIGEEHLDGGSCCLVLGDNLFYGSGLSSLLQDEVAALSGCTLFGYPVDDPSRYGVVELDAAGRPVRIEEKPPAGRPAAGRASLAVTGLYMFDGSAPKVAGALRPSARGELEITDLNRWYLEESKLKVVELGRGMAWLDTGTHDSLLEAALFVQVLERRQGLQVACVEEVAYRMGYIDAAQLAALGGGLGGSRYGDYVRRLATAAVQGTAAAQGTG